MSIDARMDRSRLAMRDYIGLQVPRGDADYGAEIRMPIGLQVAQADNECQQQLRVRASRETEQSMAKLAQSTRTLLPRPADPATRLQATLRTGALQASLQPPIGPFGARPLNERVWKELVLQGK